MLQSTHETIANVADKQTYKKSTCYEVHFML